MLNREQFTVAMIEKVQHEWGLGDSIARGLCENALTEFLKDSSVDFGDPEFSDWDRYDAESVAEIYILEYGETV